MGAASGLFVVDADIDKGTGAAVGEETLRALGLDVARHPFRAETPSGGAHFVFRWRSDLPGNSVKHLPGVDIRGEGGYVVAWAPETLIAAHEAADLEEPPMALLAALAEAKARPEGAAAGSGFRFDTGDAASAWAATALAAETAALR